jgi:hypothetical protein
MTSSRPIETAWEKKVLERWQRAYPGANHEDVCEHEVDGKRVDGHHSRLRDRFNRAQDALYLALRERYVSTLLGGFAPTPEQLEQLVASANGLLQQQRVGSGSRRPAAPGAICCGDSWSTPASWTRAAARGARRRRPGRRPGPPHRRR